MRNLLLCSLIFMMSCSTFKKNSHKKSDFELSSSAWKLTSIVGFDLENTSKPVTLVFSDTNTVAGFAGCNGYGGDFTHNGSRIQFGPMMATKMACMPGIKTENQFFTVLQKANSYKIENTYLILLDDDRALATFSKMSK